MSMTPFEIRLDLLKMARDMLFDDYHAQSNRIQSEWHVAVDNAKAKGETPPAHPALPSIPSEQDIITKATALNSFVSNLPDAAPAAKVLNKKNS